MYTFQHYKWENAFGFWVLGIYTHKSGIDKWHKWNETDPIITANRKVKTGMDGCMAAA